MNILAIDAATRLGFASEVNGVRESGVENFAPHPHENSGYRWIRFHCWLIPWKEMKLDLVVYERALPTHHQRATAEIAFGFATRIEEFAARYRIPCETVHNSTLKKFATGNGRGDKTAMLRFGKTFWPRIVDDNHCDALWLLKYAQDVLVKQPVGV